MFGLGAGEILIILAFALIFIGPKKLPELARNLGKSISEFQKAKDDLLKQVSDGGSDDGPEPFEDDHHGQQEEHHSALTGVNSDDDTQDFTEEEELLAQSPDEVLAEESGGNPSEQVANVTPNSGSTSHKPSGKVNGST